MSHTQRRPGRRSAATIAAPRPRPAEGVGYVRSPTARNARGLAPRARERSMRTQLWSIAVLLALGPAVARAAPVYMRQERNGQGIEFTPTWSTSSSAGAPYDRYVALQKVSSEIVDVPSGYPTEPIGCAPASDSGYGWPSVTTKLANKDSYITNINFWNNEAVLADPTQYAAGLILDPFIRKPYAGAHTQYKIPADFNACTDDPKDDTTCWPNHVPAASYVTGYSVVQGDTAAPTFSVAAYTGNSAGAGDRRDGKSMSWIDERHFPASYPFIFKGCHQGTCTDSGGSPSAAVSTYPGAPFPIQVRDLGALPSNWSVDL